MNPAAVLVVDLVCVVVFAIAGRGAHGEALGAALVAGTAWPFLVGCLAGWGVLRVWRDPLRLRTGALLMVVTVVVGQVVRVLAGGSTHWTFVVVSVVFLTLLLVGWRWAARLASRRRGVSAS